MTAEWSDDQVVLVIDKAELMQAKPEICDAVWSACQLDERVGKTVGTFLALGLSIMIQGALQFMDE
jgi:hypothetical protein